MAYFFDAGRFWDQVVSRYSGLEGRSKCNRVIFVEPISLAQVSMVIFWGLSRVWVRSLGNLLFLVCLFFFLVFGWWCLRSPNTKCWEEDQKMQGGWVGELRFFVVMFY